MVTDGESYLNESMLTGESKPVKKERFSEVIGGSVNGNGSIHVKVEHTGKDSYLSKVIKLVGGPEDKVENAASRRSPLRS